MKKLTLDQTWKLCLSMWRWVAKQEKKGDIIYLLKEQWTTAHGYGKYEMKQDCFFCEYDKHRNSNCLACPGAGVDKDFNCMNEEYHYRLNPIAFYNKLVSLNRKRLAKKKGTK